MKAIVTTENVSASGKLKRINYLSLNLARSFLIGKLIFAIHTGLAT